MVSTTSLINSLNFLMEMVHLMKWMMRMDTARKLRTISSRLVCKTTWVRTKLRMLCLGILIVLIHGTTCSIRIRLHTLENWQKIKKHIMKVFLIRMERNMDTASASLTTHHQTKEDKWNLKLAAMIMDKNKDTLCYSAQSS